MIIDRYAHQKQCLEKSDSNLGFDFKVWPQIPIKDVKIIEMSQHTDLRGNLWTVWANDYDCGSSPDFVLDKVSVSKQNVLRGMHGDTKCYKYAAVLSGSVFFALCDYRPYLAGNTSEKLICYSIELKGNQPKAVYIPPGVLNGHYVRSEEAVFFYKWHFEGEYPDVEEQISLKWNDSRLNIDWPCSKPILQERDR